MALARLCSFFVATACLGAAGCAGGPTGDRARVVGIPLASVHSDVAFSLTTGVRQPLACAEHTVCPSETDGGAAVRFAMQVQRVAAVLQKGVEAVYPDLTERVPDLSEQRFDVYVVEGDQPGSASSANGRIALNAALGSWRPYDDWVAFVIAREMGHVIARHHEENSAASIAVSVLLNIILPGSGLLKSALSAGGSSIASFSKREVQATEADAIAFSLLKAAGFQLRDVSLSLLVAPMSLADSGWSNRFRKSSDGLLAAVRNEEIAVAALPQQALN